MQLNLGGKIVKSFQTLGDAPFDEVHKNTIVSELRAAGFPRGCETLTSREHKTDCAWLRLYDVKAELYGWEFRRAWYYWVARTNNSDRYIQQIAAETFNETYRHQVRVGGYTGGQDVWGDTSHYHIDTPGGFVAFVEMLKKHDAVLRAERGW